MNKGNSKIALQSRKWLMDALLDLMNRYEYDAITISQICRKADLSRRTFYRLYHCKEDMLIEKCTLLMAEYRDLLYRDSPISYIDMASTYFEFCYLHRDFFIQLKKSNLLSKIFFVIEESFPELCGSLQRSDNSICQSKALRYINSYSIGGLNNMLLQWIRQDMDATPKELLAALTEFLHSVNAEI